MKISENTRIWIYGYGSRGRKIKEKLKNAGYAVYGYIDQNPDQYEQDRKDDLIVKLCDATPISEDIVICSITNVFKHAAIAKQIFNKGFQYIIYKCFAQNEAAKCINNLYDTLTDSLTDTYEFDEIAEKWVPEYFETCREEEAVLNNEKYICVNIPVELLFGMTRNCFLASLKNLDENLVSAIPEKSLLYYTQPKHMMQYFSGGEIREDVWKICKSLWYACRNFQTFSDISENHFDETNQMQNIKDRYAIYQEMENLFNYNISFFSENPIHVVWNQNGWFNIQDGNNRAAFLLAKGIYWIPSRMYREDYDAWMDVKPKIDQVKRALICIRKPLRVPILHPLLRNVPAQMETYYHRKAAALCDWLWREDLKPESLKVLEYGCENDLCGSHFARMGSELIVCETEEQMALHKALDSLYKLKKVAYYDKDNISNETFDVLMSNLSVPLSFFVENNIKSNWYILECIDQSDLEIKEILARNNLILSEYLMKTLVANQIYKVIIAKGD